MSQLSTLLKVRGQWASHWAETKTASELCSSCNLERKGPVSHLSQYPEMIYLLCLIVSSPIYKARDISMPVTPVPLASELRQQPPGCSFTTVQTRWEGVSEGFVQLLSGFCGGWMILIAHRAYPVGLWF